MRKYISQCRSIWLPLLSSLMVLVSGCGDKPVPDSAYPGASREFMENPAAAAAKLKGIEAEKSKAESKVSAKVAAARAKAALADPRGK